MVSKKKLFISALLLLLGLSLAAYAHSEMEAKVRIDNVIINSSVNIVMGATVLIVLLILLTVYYHPKGKKKKERVKIFLFSSIVLVTTIATVWIAGGTIYLNFISETKGPIHWHADFELWKCGQELNLIDPSGLSNRIGTPVFHEHGDLRLHVEGVVVEKSHVDLDTFFRVIGGVLTTDYFAVPTNEGMVGMRNGDQCNGRRGVLQVFLYKVINPDPFMTKGFLYKQEKLDNFEEYVVSPYINMPPGDCLIFEFDEEKETTDKICESFKIAIDKGNLKEASDGG